ncbi:dodecenoyl-CoA isomerase [Rhizina undulata]
MSTEALLLEIRKNVAIITINQPKKLNALGGNEYYQLAALLRKIALMDVISVTVLTGIGRYFSAGADVASFDASATKTGDEDTRKYWLRRFAANNIEVTKAFFEHPKILVTALNGPVIGLSAALIAFSDFIFASESSFLLTPFTSLGLVAEGGASYMFMKRMGISKANEALMLSKKIPAAELLASGFINKIFPAGEGFHEAVFKHIDDVFGNHINHESMMGIKKLIRQQMEHDVENANVKEAFAGLERFVQGTPQMEFQRIAAGQKKHKL